METASEDIDDALYRFPGQNNDQLLQHSPLKIMILVNLRQRYVLGDSAMKRMANSDVYLSGLGGIGAEIAKNVVLAGVKSLTVHDKKTATVQDLGTQFLLREEDVKELKNRAEASVPRLAELNPYVTVKTSSHELTVDSDLSFLAYFKCVIITEATLGCQLKLNEYCRSQQPPIKFIMADVYGVHSYIFCDFGDEFTIVDSDGEEPKESFIASITQDDPGEVTTLNNQPHGLLYPTDYVTFREVKGMTALNGRTCKITVKSPFVYTIGDLTGEEFQPYENGGIATQVKMPEVMTCDSLSAQLKSPSTSMVDFKKDPNACHLAIYSLLQFMEEHRRVPIVRSTDDANSLVTIANRLRDEVSYEIKSLDIKTLLNFAYTAAGSFAPVCAAMGGIAAQEVLKALTGKFTPINQWMFINASEFLEGQESLPVESFQLKGDRYDSLRICIGEQMLDKLSNLKIFMVGCGAIGCEMMKNYAMLGIGTSENGKITITDHDLIEKSNLNRQFLFRPHHIQKPKSNTAAESTLEINPALQIEAHQQKVCKETEETHYTDAFFQQTDIVVNALDNVEARQYVDSRCVKNRKPLLESGTTGTAGHVQVIVPDVTENYSSQRDLTRKTVPFCTIKSFPATIEHTIQWARDKFESLFNLKPNMYNKYWATHGLPEQVLKKLQDGAQLENTAKSLKLLKNQPDAWDGCLAVARVKFEKYFNHKAKQILHIFPPDGKTKQGEPFWQSPRRQPSPVVFDSTNKQHMLFIVSSARLYAACCNVTVTDEDLSEERVLTILQNVKIPSFRPTKKKIITDVSEELDTGSSHKLNKPGRSQRNDDTNIQSCISDFQELELSGRTEKKFLQMSAQEFEKDDDTNGHIDFITAASNLRAAMYSIEHADRFKTKRIAGSIVPAIATTTAAVSGLVTLELIRYVKGAELKDYHNCFLNLGLASVMFSQPGRPSKTAIIPGLSYSPWDMWQIKGNPGFKLKDFVQYFQDEYSLSVSMVLLGSLIVYMPMLPEYSENLPQKMVDLIKVSDGVKYVDLYVTYDPEDMPERDEDLTGPSVRYYFGV